MASFQSLLLQPSFSRLQAAHTGEFDLELQPRYGPPIPCHASLLRARCPLLQIERPCMSVISVLLEWVYCEKIHFRGAEGSVGLGLAERTLRLAAKLGLRDALALRERLYGNWRRRSSGCLTWFGASMSSPSTTFGSFAASPVPTRSAKQSMVVFYLCSSKSAA
eukprot:s3010_g5.t1